jgi:nucleotide-binding universal stress UspA family protein
MKRILVGLDASPRAPETLKAAIDLATSVGGKLILFRAVGVPVEIPVEAYTMTPSSLAEMLERDAKLYLEQMAAALPKDRVEDTVVDVGTAWQCLCAAAERLQVDLIVIGSHGYSGLDRLIGTTAGKVVNHARQSVLVVRGHPGFARATES